MNKEEFVESKMEIIYSEWECSDKLSKAREVIESIYDEYVYKPVNNSGVLDGVMLSSAELSKKERIAYLKGVTEYTVWADCVPNGNEKCDSYIEELRKINSEA